MLSKKFEGTSISAYSVDPGFVRTDRYLGNTNFLKINLLKMYGYVAGKNPLQGAQTILHCITANNLDNGGFYADCRKVRNSKGGIEVECVLTVL